MKRPTTKHKMHAYSYFSMVQNTGNFHSGDMFFTTRQGKRLIPSKTAQKNACAVLGLCHMVSEMDRVVSQLHGHLITTMN